ncbi:MAG TPA: CmcI family methyltransferase [Pyrinomonadaceae bacterium]
MISIDLEQGLVTVEENGSRLQHAIGSAEAFEVLSNAWLRSGWDNKHVYSFTWFGRPIIQLPEDMVRLQEVIYAVQPDVIIETGIAHGGSLVFYASLCKAMERGRVVGIDIEIRPHNRQALEAHPLSPLITLIEGSSIDPEVVSRVRAQVQPGETVLVLLDSCHTRQHVLDELNAYSPLVTAGSYIVAMDGIMEQVSGAPRTQADWTWNNPRAAALEFVAAHPEFIIDDPQFRFNESNISKAVTYWPSGYIKRVG